MEPVLLQVEDLQTSFFSDRGESKAVDRVSFSVRGRQVVGLVGESGCGKSVTAHSIMRLIPPPGKITGGRVLFSGRNLLDISEEEMRALRGDRISMIFQEPMTSLNPVFRIEDQITEVIRQHRRVSARDAWGRAVKLLGMVGIPSPEQRMKEYPHRLSGGMRQRVMIAMAIACDPQLIIADEPTTALDVTIQAQILDLLLDLRDETGTAILLITHDLGVVAQVAEHVVVMYTGRVVEEAPVEVLFSAPLHPYTIGLMRSIPASTLGTGSRLETIPGMVPSVMDLPAGCKFNTRCDKVFGRCMLEEPPLLDLGNDHRVRCWLAGGN